MHSGPSYEGLFIADVTGYHIYKSRVKFKFLHLVPYNIFRQLMALNNQTNTLRYLLKALTRSGSSYGLRTVLNLEDEEPSSHSSVDPVLPKITGILSAIVYLVSNTGSREKFKMHLTTIAHYKSFSNSIKRSMKFCRGPT